jgi:hypothetical protein
MSTGGELRSEVRGQIAEVKPFSPGMSITRTENEFPSAEEDRKFRNLGLYLCNLTSNL